MMERDEEIELVIARFEEESTAAQNQANRVNEEKTNKLRDKHSTQLREVITSSTSYSTRNNTYISIDQRVREDMEDEVLGRCEDSDRERRHDN